MYVFLNPLEKKEKRRNYTYITIFLRKKNSGKLYNMMENWGSEVDSSPGEKPKISLLCSLKATSASMV